VLDRRAHDRAVALHADDAVDDREAGGIADQRSTIDSTIPFQWSRFFGHPTI
jgi:hypothetical protein